MQIGHVLGNAVSFGAIPRALADTVTRVHRPWSLSAQIPVPGSVSSPSRGGQHLAVLIGARQAAQVRALSHANAGYEETHGWGRPFCLRLLRYRHRRPQQKHGEHCKSRTHTILLLMVTVLSPLARPFGRTSVSGSGV